jgi:trimethylamine-N-oxide reductase (cytochrome c)
LSSLLAVTKIDPLEKETKMSESSTPRIPARFSRRTFLEATGAAGAMGMTGASLLSFGAAAAVPQSGTVLTGSHWGAFRAKVEGGRIVSYTPWEKDLFPSAQLKGVVDSVYSASRIKYPMVRRAYLEKGPGADPGSRGSGDFVRVSWDQALDLVTKELGRIEKTYGPAATFAGSYGWKSPGKLHNCQNLLRRMMNLKGSFVNSSGDFSTGASQVVMPHVVGTLEVYEQQTVWPVVWKVLSWWCSGVPTRC